MLVQCTVERFQFASQLDNHGAFHMHNAGDTSFAQAGMGQLVRTRWVIRGSSHWLPLSRLVILKNAEGRPNKSVCGAWCLPTYSISWLRKSSFYTAR